MFEFVAVLAEVKPPDSEIIEMAVSIEQNNQVGRYLGRTGVMLLCNIGAVGLLECKPGYVRQVNTPVPPDKRQLLATVSLWPSEDAFSWMLSPAVKPTNLSLRVSRPRKRGKSPPHRDGGARTTRHAQFTRQQAART